MKSNALSHREALDQALRTALGTSQPALRRQAFAQARRHILHPRFVLESPLLTDQHPWRREALVVSDAFEAVTNGMEEPGVLEALDEVEDDSPFAPWRSFILGLHFFYEGLDEAVRVHWGRIPNESPVSGWSRLGLALLERRGADLPEPWRALAQAVTRPDAGALQTVTDVAEGLETDDEDLFVSALADWLEQVAPHSTEAAQAGLVWAWQQLAWREFDEQTLLDLGSSWWGRSESYRLAAVGTAEWDAQGADLLWLRFGVSALRLAEWSRDEALEATEWLGLFDAAADSEPWSPEAEDLRRNLRLTWNAEVQLRGWLDLRVEPSAPAHPEAPRPRMGSQLDLFA